MQSQRVVGGGCEEGTQGCRWGCEGRAREDREGWLGCVQGEPERIGKAG